MYITNRDIRARARYLLDDNIFGKDWIKSVVLTILASAIVGTAGSIVISFVNTLFLPIILMWFDQGSIVSIIIPILLTIVELLSLNILIGPLYMGLSTVHLDLVRGEGKIKIGHFFRGFKNFGANVQLGLMYMLHIFLWSLLFIIPGIYVSYSYALVFYVKHDNPEFTWKECFDESERLMDGNKWRLFKLQFSFIGWAFLGAIAFFGIGSYWVMPYEQVSLAVFYDVLLAEKDEDEED